MMQWANALSILVLSIVSASRRRPNIVEESQTKTTLHILDDSIVDYLSKPAGPNSRSIFAEIVSYNTNFEEIIDGFKERKFKFVRIAHVLYDKGGPNFMKLRIDAPIFMKVNGWTMTDMGELYHLLKNTDRLWRAFKQVYEEVKTAVKGNWTQLKSTYGTETLSDRLNVTAMLQNIAEIPETPVYSTNVTEAV